MKKYNKIITTAFLLSAVSILPAFAGTWQEDNGKWRYINDDNRPAVNSWISHAGTYYAMDENGYMRTGWFQDGQIWYFLDPRSDGNLGSMMTGWQWIDGYCYYLDPYQGGALTVSGMTPDGYRVNESGAWLDAGGNPYYTAGKGILTNPPISDTVSQNEEETSDDSDWQNYRYSMANDFMYGNYGMMTEEQRKAVEGVIETFKKKHIRDDMTDFEKELMIIQWIVDHCVYGSTTTSQYDWTDATAYSCLVRGKAVCSGYADAFMQMGRACGLDVRYVHNDVHAWNLIQLDGEWYHVDVTWEDPIGRNTYGIGYLRNLYINLTDDEICAEESSHWTWSPNTIQAYGEMYGKEAVARYMKTDDYDSDDAWTLEEYVEEFYDNIVDRWNHDGYVIEFDDVDDTVEEISEFIDEIIEDGEESFSILIKYPEDYFAGNSKHKSKVAKYAKRIKKDVEEYVNDTYGDILNDKFVFSDEVKADPASQFYLEYEVDSFTYNE